MAVLSHGILEQILGFFTRKSNKQMVKQVKDGKGFNLGIKHN